MPFCIFKTINLPNLIKLTGILVNLANRLNLIPNWDHLNEIIKIEVNLYNVTLSSKSLSFSPISMQFQNEFIHSKYIYTENVYIRQGIEKYRKI